MLTELVNSLLAHIFPVRLGFVELGPEYASSTEYYRHLMQRRGDLNDHAGQLEDAVSEPKAWHRGQWRPARWSGKHFHRLVIV